jgi:hypothetical protein
MPGGANPPIPPEGENPDQAVPLHFMQQPWVQDVLPFVTSLMLHALIVIFGILSYKAYQIVKAPPTEEQITIPDSQIVENQPPGGVPFQGLGENPFKQAQQDTTPEGGKVGPIKKDQP